MVVIGPCLVLSFRFDFGGDNSLGDAHFRYHKAELFACLDGKLEHWNGPR